MFLLYISVLEAQVGKHVSFNLYRRLEGPETLCSNRWHMPKVIWPSINRGHKACWNHMKFYLIPLPHAHVQFNFYLREIRGLARAKKFVYFSIIIYFYFYFTYTLFKITHIKLFIFTSHFIKILNFLDIIISLSSHTKISIHFLLLYAEYVKKE